MELLASQKALHDSPEFAQLRSRFRRFVFPVTVGFLVWYFAYVLAANYAHDFMSTNIVGNINVALVWGLLQFVSTFGIAWWYSKKAASDFDPLATELRERFEGAAK
ncbi:MAG TPA: DUF485 domain-containing protein [Actinomycetes bacterium]|nr:DUF485 domain-containing protein [Actinomycetes bacterium]